MQSQWLSQKFGLVHLNISSILRSEVINKSSLGFTISSFLEQLTLVPNDIVINLLRHRLNSQDVKLNGFVLEGFPKTLEQLEWAVQ